MVHGCDAVRTSQDVTSSERAEREGPAFSRSGSGKTSAEAGRVANDWDSYETTGNRGI